MNSFSPNKTVLKVLGSADLPMTEVKKTWGTKFLNNTNVNMDGRANFSLADAKEIFGFVRCDTAGKLNIYQGAIIAGRLVWMVKTQITVTASTFSTGAFTTDGVSLGTIAVAGEFLKAEFLLDSAGTTNNFELYIGKR